MLYKCGSVIEKLKTTHKEFNETTGQKKVVMLAVEKDLASITRGQAMKKQEDAAEEEHGLSSTKRSAPHRP